MLVFGQVAPDFATVSMEGDSLRLKDFTGHYLLIDFWGSWCAPCRAENPILSLLYARYKDQVFKSAKGIRFVSVALDNQPESVKSAIQKDGLAWSEHILEDQSMNGNVARLFGIKSIPMKYLIGPDGRIILADPDIKELDDYLAKDILKN